MSVIQKLWGLLTPPQQRQSAVVFGLMLISMVMETLSIGLVIPALALMTQGDLQLRYPLLAPWLNSVGNPSPAQLVVAGMLILVTVAAAKALFLGFFAWWQARFVSRLQASLSQRLFAIYLFQPYSFHLQRNSALLIRNVMGQVGVVINVVQQGLMLLAEVFVLLGISILLLIVEPLGALLVVSTLGLAGWGFTHVTHRRLVRWGVARQLHEGLRIQHLQQGLGGAKDVKLLGRESEFLAQYSPHNDGSARVAQHQTTLQALPRLWLELLAVIGLAALVLVMIWQQKPAAARHRQWHPPYPLGQALSGSLARIHQSRLPRTQAQEIFQSTPPDDATGISADPPPVQAIAR